MPWLWLALGLLLGGCASAFPEEVMRAVNRSLTVEELRGDPAAHRNERVIVGGEILSTQPRPGETQVELLTRRLRWNDSPERSDWSSGRVLLKTTEFLDPAVYAPGRRLTVVGTVTGEEERKVGELPYHYPVITVERLRLWPEDIVAGPAYYPTFSWWGYCPWPYYPYFLY
jgi:outer membrane lipoprotein